MSNLSLGAENARPARVSRRWAPRGAVVLAVLGMLLALVPLWYGTALMIEAGTGSPTDADAIAAALGQVALFASVSVLALLGWFLVRGGRFPFLVGTGMVAVGLLWFGTLFLP